MDSLFSLPLPFQRRLTKMYADTKSSSDFVKEPVQSAEDPELLSLHRKLRIQKDRLVSWGLEWSDPTQSPDIDESISKAGLSELVGSVMSTIKEILAEAEPLWQSSASKRGSGDEKLGLGSSEKSSMDRKPSLIMWDKSRFQDLVRDLTMSIDTLYDLSRTRQSARKSASLKISEPSSSLQKKPVAVSDAVVEKLFESTRMQTPQQIDPNSLIWPSDLQRNPIGMLAPAKSSRHIVFIRRPVSGPGARSFSNQNLPVVPILLEHAPYDPIYSITGITPSMTRFEKLFAGLSQAYISGDRITSGVLPLIGYFEEPEQSRFCLLFALPTHFGPIDIASPRVPSVTMLSDILYGGSNFEPSLEIKYRLAYNLANAVFDLHSKGVVHGNILASNILFIEHQPSSRLDLEEVNMRQPHLASYDLFSDIATDGSETTADAYTNLHRHPLDPRITRYTRLTSESKSLDLYSLAMLLLEIGLWTSLSDAFPSVAAVPENPVAVLKRLAARCGGLYVKAVQACWHAPEDELSQKARPDVMHQKVFWKVSKALDTCCAIDESSEGSSEDGDVSVPAPLLSARSGIGFRDQKSPSLASMAPSTPPLWTEKSSFSRTASFAEKPQYTDVSALIASIAVPTDVKVSKPKLKTYPAIRISQEHLDYWHTFLMPNINQVLRSFYKKHPESVEISLESVGETSATTKPTILVICTSVNRVRSILKKSLVYDPETYGLKVCRGKVVRSRKQGTRRSMANEFGEIKPVNADHQERPSNGASIGAYVGERHLPPVSFGGMIVVDDKAYGLTVHHMLDDPSEGEEEEEETATAPILRSSAYYLDMPDLTHSESSVYSSGDEEYMYSLSDYDSDFDSEADDDDVSDDESEIDEDSDDGMEAGDIKGIPQGCGEEYLITQPAIDDVSEDFFPSEETRDEDHLDSFQVGEVYASSGIRRRTENNVVHEIDWALFEFNEERCPEGNRISNGSRFFQGAASKYPEEQQIYPLTTAPLKDLNDLQVHCIARTSGLQPGRILPGMVIVKIYGRQTPSSSYQVAGKLGVPGDSGAWVVDNEQGRACGHVLAWSSRKKVAYICPMDVILRDVGETLGASSVGFPGGEPVFNASSSPVARTTDMSNSTMTLKTNPHQLPQGQDVAIRSFEEQGVDVMEDDLSSLLRELHLPPTPSQIDAIDPLAEEADFQFRDFQARHRDNAPWGRGKEVGFENRGQGVEANGPLSSTGGVDGGLSRGRLRGSSVGIGV